MNIKIIVLNVTLSLTVFLVFFFGLYNMPDFEAEYLKSYKSSKKTNWIPLKYSEKDEIIFEKGTKNQTIFSIYIINYEFSLNSSKILQYKINKTSLLNNEYTPHYEIGYEITTNGIIKFPISYKDCLYFITNEINDENNSIKFQKQCINEPNISTILESGTTEITAFTKHQNCFYYSR
jgi:hypothetical protein